MKVNSNAVQLIQPTRIFRISSDITTLILDPKIKTPILHIVCEFFICMIGAFLIPMEPRLLLVKELH